MSSECLLASLSLQPAHASELALSSPTATCSLHPAGMLDPDEKDTSGKVR